MIHDLQNKAIAIDIDDVLSDTIPNLLRYLEENHDLVIMYDDFRTYDLQKAFRESGKDFTMEETFLIWDSFAASPYGKYMKPVNGSLEAITTLKEKGYELYLISSRRESLRKRTTNWLDKMFPGIFFEGIYFTGNPDGSVLRKSDVCLSNGINLMIEDNAEYCLELSERGIKSYLLNKPWNLGYEISDPNIKRIGGWDDIII